ncbi:OmpW family outer membrane protein [Paraglaciecola aquimarina]|uniref:OmpW family outer membrane protein n=1 Tax=Paraglaciecola aquimarina TaxID=1235557 RepID=A0ABU3SYG9_9ALTE|nr:OmpW family outer membrane protein [Paraglaciecola aquimarina]MDU0355058.1 OmpW family outer membrane protein [Paraglaciecola aquimarina]
MKNKLCSLALIITGLTSSLSVQAYETGNLLIRTGLTAVRPDAASDNVLVDGNDLGMGVSVDNNSQLGININYFLSPKIAIEILLATPFKHDIDLNTVGALGTTKHLPPTVSINFYFAESTAVLQPYVGAGINYTVFFDEEFTTENSQAGFSDLSLDDSIGLSAQAGIDYILNDNWQINASLRWININTTADFKLNNASGSVDVDIDPFVYTLSIGYRFN